MEKTAARELFACDEQCNGSRLPTAVLQLPMQSTRSAPAWIICLIRSPFFHEYVKQSAADGRLPVRIINAAMQRLNFFLFNRSAK